MCSVTLKEALKHCVLSVKWELSLPYLLQTLNILSFSHTHRKLSARLLSTLSQFRRHFKNSREKVFDIVMFPLVGKLFRPTVRQAGALSLLCRFLWVTMSECACVCMCDSSG